MADEDVSDADNIRIRDFVVRFLYDYNLAKGEGVPGTVIQQSYIDQVDRVAAESSTFIKNQKRIFKTVVNLMIEEGTTVDLFENSDGKNVLRLYDFVGPRDIYSSSNKENSNEHAEQVPVPNVHPDKSHKKINRNLMEGIDPKGLAPKFRKRRITEVEESDTSGNDTHSISYSNLGSRNPSPQRSERPALASLDGNRRISAPEQFYSPSVPSEHYPQMEFFPNQEPKDEKMLSLPIWLQRGLSELHQKYPDSRFEATDGYDITCTDCDTEHKVAKYKKTNNFENHLKSKSHLENVKFRLDNFTSSRPPSALSTYSAMPPPPLPFHIPAVPPVVALPDNSNADGGLLESMIANVVQQSTGPLTAHIRNLENRLLASENTHKQKFEKMTRQLDESENRNRELFSRLEECKLSTEELSARLLATEAESREQKELSNRVRLLEQTNESLQASRSSHAAQLKDAQGSIKALKQAPIPSIESAITDHANRLMTLGKRYEGTAQDLSRHCQLEEDLRNKMISQMEGEHQKLNERVNLLQTAVASRHGDLEELNNKVSHGPQHDQSKSDALRSQLASESDAHLRQFSIRIKAIEKKVIQDSMQFTALDHRTAEWIGTTDRKHDSKLAELESAISERLLTVRAGLMGHIDDLKKQQTGKDGAVDARIERRLAAAEKMIGTVHNQLLTSQNQLAATEQTLSEFVSNFRVHKCHTESLASNWKAWQEEREEEFRNLDIEVMKNSSAMEELQIEHTVFLETTPKTIQQVERRLEEQSQASINELLENLKSSEGALTEKICALQETQVKYRQFALELQHKQSDTLMNRMDEKVHNLERMCVDLSQKTKEIQKHSTFIMDQKMQERLKSEFQSHKATAESLIRNFVSKRDRELQAKYEETFKPMLMKFLTEKDQALRKEYDENIENAFQARMLSREKELEIKYEERFKPLIASFLIDQQKVLRDEYEARIEQLLGVFKDEILSADKENKNPSVKSEEELKSLVLDVTEERESALLKEHEADIEELIGIHRAEMGLLEEQTLERLLTLEQVIKDQAQQIEDMDCVFPLVLDDLNGLMMKRRLRDRGLKKDRGRVCKDGR
ncbi:c0474d14-bfc2-46eb-93cb-f58074e68cee [Sclerotinia trifoliorum]|uniref:C0474d14-bfc2-46eb-93cb-f58074e68cee n=1 Tax=Sclerotinia trifoliorum TaxID=28548 RepID=A0A8H2VKZ8_9HELO|nr:c0474d14-bfc2-46eb-93cb-f58074e68cee [Sclerotinia trifoliorum]